jgi:raffinose/stachyose/melibiose transport system substrate-binding protein
VSTATPNRRRHLVTSLAVVGISALLLSACASGGASAKNPAKLSYLKNTENTTIEPVFTALSTGPCAAEQKVMPLDVNSTPQAGIDAKVQTLAASNALPVMFATAGTPSDGVKLANANKLVNFDTAFKDLGVSDDILPGAKSTIEQLYGGTTNKFDFLPFQYNIEGIFYNKDIFAANNISQPKTWDELTADAAKLDAAGIQPLSASGQQGWPLTRLIGDYIFRDLGADALKKVADGKAKLTDPDYVKAAQAVADLGAKGYFGSDVASLDYDGATNQFLTGKSAMIYMGSWLLANINDPKQDVIGVDKIGFMPFPAVSGGKGSIDEYPSNVGLPSTFGASTYSKDNNTGKWLKCIAENFGSEALKQGQITGFKVNTPVSGLSSITSAVNDTLNTNKAASVLWFEALFNAKASSDSNTNAALLVTGQMTAEKFMQTVQDDLDNN